MSHHLHAGVPAHWAPRAIAAGVVLLSTLGLTGCSTPPGWMVLQGQSRVSDHQHFDNASITRAALPSPLPDLPAALQWPDDADTSHVEAMAAANHSLALLVVRRGTLVYERYFNGHSRQAISGSMSVAKSVVSALLGIAQAEGQIGSMDEPITRWLPELLANDARFAQISLRHLLLMRSGIAFNEDYRSPLSDAARFYLTDNLQAELGRLRIETPPDTAYHYKSGDTQLLAMALQRAVGLPLAQYAQSRLWQPMGAEFDASWSLDSAAHGQARAFCCLNATARDFARFGLVFLNGGLSNGRQIVPADWVRDSTAVQQRPGADAASQRNVEAPSPWHMAYYAWQWRRAPQPGPAPIGQLRPPGNDFYARGLHGQFIYVAPDSQTVVVRLGTATGDVNWPAWMGELARRNP